MSEQMIKPSNTTPTHLRHLQSSLFDHRNEPFFMPLIFFYSPKQSNITTTQFLYRLRNSLPATLSVLYPLAGRVQDSEYIDCNDQGVPYIEAEVSSCFQDFIHKAEVCQLDKLLPYHGKDGYTRLLLAIQVNAFRCGGVAIGVKTSHALVDGFSLVAFVKTWAAIASGQDYRKIVGEPYFEISNLFPPPSRRQDETNFDPFETDVDFTEYKPECQWFRFSKAKMEDLRSKFISNKKVGNVADELNRPSLFTVLSAFIMSRIKLGCRENPDNIPYQVYSAVNIRSKVQPPKGSYFYGNMAINALVKPCMMANDTQTLSSKFIDDFRKSIREILSDTGMIRNVEEGKEDLSFMVDHFEKVARGEVTSLGFSNVKSLGVYESDFGWGQPVWVTSATLLFKDLIIFIPASPSTDDIIAYINLTAKEMRKLATDAEFLSFTSTQAWSKL